MTDENVSAEQIAALADAREAFIAHIDEYADRDRRWEIRCGRQDNEDFIQGYLVAIRAHLQARANAGRVG